MKFRKSFKRKVLCNMCFEKKNYKIRKIVMVEQIDKFSKLILFKEKLLKFHYLNEFLIVKYDL